MDDPDADHRWYTVYVAPAPPGLHAWSLDDWGGHPHLHVEPVVALLHQAEHPADADGQRRAGEGWRDTRVVYGVLRPDEPEVQPVTAVEHHLGVLPAGQRPADEVIDRAAGAGRRRTDG